MAKRGSVTLRGRYPAGSTVRLVHVEGPHVLRPGPHHETVATEKVDDDGTLSFTKGVEAGARYFAVGQVNGQPLEVRLTGREDADDGFLAGYDPSALQTRTRLADGSWADEAPEQHQKMSVPDGATWRGQHQVPKGTLQRSDTPRGTAVPISAEELERIGRDPQRKQEPTEPIVQAAEEVQEDPESAPARTSRPAAKSPATSSSKGKN
jgi:hypothetical protein